MTDVKELSTPDKIAKRGETIYQERYKDRFERKFHGQFVVIDVSTEEAYIAPYPEEALEKAQNASENGIFHLIRIGAPGAFRVSYVSHGNRPWALRPAR